MAFLDQISKNLAGYGKEAAKKAMSTKCSSLRSKTQWSTLQNWKKS